MPRVVRKKMSKAPVRPQRGRIINVKTSKSKSIKKLENSTPFGPFGAGYPLFGPGIGGGFNPIGYPGNQGFPGDEQISEVNTGFKNMRWYFVSNMRNFLSELYVEIGLVQKITNMPVDDGLRGGIEIKSKQISEEQIDALSNSLDRNDEINIAGQAEKWNRLFGGAGILILTDDDPDEPFVLEKVTKDSNLEFRAVDMWELFFDKEMTEGFDPAVDSETFEFYSYYGVQVHKSRVMRLKGLTAPSFLRPRLRGWGFSVAEALIRPLNQYLKGTDLAFEVTDEFKIDVYKIKNYVNTLMSPQGEQSVAKRINAANWGKNYQKALIMDKEDEWDHKQLSFSGLAEMAAENRIQIASELGMPLTKIFGISSAGFNSGEDDIENYNSMVESQVRNKLKYPILRIIEIKCQEMFGFVPSDLSISFKPLRMLSSEQEETVKEKKFNRIMQASAAGKISDEEWRDACNKGNLFDIKLDPNAIPPSGYMQDTIQEGSNNPYNPQDIDNPGADRLDTRKSKATEIGGAGKEASNPDDSDGNDEPRNIAKIKPKKNWLRRLFSNASWEDKPILNKKVFKEEEHPRASDGQFTKGGEGGATSEKPQSKPKPTEAEGAAIRSYTGVLSDLFDKADRGEKVDAEFVKKNKDFNKFLQKSPKYEGTIYRGVAVSKDEVKDFLERYEPGQVIKKDVKEKWTKDPNVGKSQSIIDGKEKWKAVHISFEYPDSKVGVDVSDSSRFSEYQEVVTPPNTSYQVKEVIKSGDDYKIIMEPTTSDASTTPVTKKIKEAPKPKDKIKSVNLPIRKELSGNKEAQEKEDKNFFEKTKPIFEKIEEDNPTLSKALYAWTQDYFAQIRDLQTGKLEKNGNENIEKMVKDMESGFDSLPRYEGSIVRYLKIKDKSILAKMKPNETLEMDAFSSFTFLKDHQKFEEVSNVEIIVDKNKSGRAIWGVSNIEDEGEILVPKGTKYKITKVEKSGSITKVHVEEVSK